VTTPTWLIAEREFRAYTATASFWIALAVGPLMMAAGLGLTALATAPRPPITVAVHADDPALAREAMTALAGAAAIEGRRLVPTTDAAAAPARMEVVRGAGGAIDAEFSAGFPLSASGMALIASWTDREEAARRLRAAGIEAPPPTARARVAADPGGAEGGPLSRFCLVMILWLTLTGSLGMLLQAVVRERANRALESLLAAARPWEIMLGKLGGVGAVSVLVLCAWLASAAAFAALGHDRGGVALRAIGALAAPAALARAGAIYLLAYGFYGLVTFGVGAAARDSASAQNLSRPMFAVLLAAFFAALAGAFGLAGALAWLVYIPPFTPFMLLLEPPGAMSAPAQLAAVGLLIAATAIAGVLAAGRVTLGGDRGVAKLRTRVAYGPAGGANWPGS
jgi:ABC-2 type transport system permease protein